jgi:sugar lactone lactonase YvrE
MSVRHHIAVSVCALAFAAALGACGPRTEETAAPAPPPAWTVEPLAPPSPFSGVHGLAVAPDGKILAGSVVGQAILAVDPATGATSVFRGPPDGMADDIAFAPDGTMAWTGYLTGTVWIQKPGEAPKQIASGLPGANSLAFNASGELWFTQVFLGDALYKADLAGGAPKKIAADLGGLNGFQFGADGMIYGPLWFKGVIVKVDPVTGKATTVASGFKTPAAVNLDSKGRIWTLDTATGEVIRMDPKGGARTVIAQLASSLDNLAIAPDDTVYVSNMADGAIHRIDAATGAVTAVTSHSFAAPADLAISGEGAAQKLHLADTFAYRTIDLATGAIESPLRMYRDQLENPIAIDVGATGVTLVSWAAGTVQRVDMATGKSLALWHGFAAPADAVEVTGGDIIVAELGSGRLIRVAVSDSEKRTHVAEGLEGPCAMIWDGADAVFISEPGAGRVRKVTLSTGERSVVAEGLMGPEGLALANDDRLIIAETGARRVTAINLGTGAREVLVENLPIGLAGPAGTPPGYLTTGLAVAANGDIYLSSDLDNTVYRLRQPASAQ